MNLQSRKKKQVLFVEALINTCVDSYIALMVLISWNKYDIFSRAAYVILKDSGSPTTAQKCKFTLLRDLYSTYQTFSSHVQKCLWCFLNIVQVSFLDCDKFSYKSDSQGQQHLGQQYLLCPSMVEPQLANVLYWMPSFLPQQPYKRYGIAVVQTF